MTTTKFVARDEAIFDFRDLSKVQLKNDYVPAFGTKWDDVLSAVTDRPTGNMFRSLRKAQCNLCCKSTFKRCHSATRNTTIADRSHWPKDILSRKSTILFKARNRNEDSPCNGSSRQRKKEKAKTMTKTTPTEETVYVGVPKANSEFSWDYAVNSRRSGTDNLFIADTQDLKPMPPSDILLEMVHNKRGGHSQHGYLISIPMWDGAKSCAPLCTKRWAALGARISRFQSSEEEGERSPRSKSRS